MFHQSDMFLDYLKIAKKKIIVHLIQVNTFGLEYYRYTTEQAYKGNA